MRKILIITLLALGSVIEAQYCDTTFFPGDIPYFDTYHDVAADLANWKHYNTHDPTVNKQGDWYYMYSTDASWAGLNENGSLKRRSKDLVNWEFMGNAFDGVPQSAQNFFKNSYNPNYTDNGVWAPFLHQYKGKYRLYYSAPGGLDGVNLAVIGYTTSDSANGPWDDQGLITTSIPGDTINAIDPSVIYDSLTHKLWMAYGSWFTGIYAIELDTATGGIKTEGDRGVRIANRKTTAYGQEGPELTYRNGWYYLFVSYDGLGDLYNVRVGRSKTPNGPYTDFNGTPLTSKSDNIPMIMAPYRFNNHYGWQGTGHCGVFNDNGKYFFFNQGRPSIEPAMMVLHVREIFWINNWPVLSPERFAGVPHCTVPVDSLYGIWEHMPLKYHNSTTSNYRSTSVPMEISANGTFNNNNGNTWTFESDTLVLNWSNGDVHKLITLWDWDWENNCKTISYTGIDQKGTCIWGKKINQTEVDRYTVLEDGATYTIRNLHSHLLLQAPANTGATISQGTNKFTDNQLWKLKSTVDGYFYLLPKNNTENGVLEVSNNSSSNGADLKIGILDGSLKQKFKLYYNFNGYFRILTKASDTKSCADVFGFSTADGAKVAQWEYLGGLNQQWRFEKTDSIAVDSIPIDTFNVSLPAEINQLKLQVFPNPTTEYFTFNYELSSAKTVKIIIYNATGQKVLTVIDEFQIAGMHSAEGNLKAFSQGVYYYKLETGNEITTGKLLKMPAL